METKEKTEVKEEVKQEEKEEKILEEQIPKEESQQEESLAEKDQKEETKEKQDVPFLNKKVSKDDAKAFFAGVASTLIVGLALCSVSHGNFYHPEFHPENKHHVEMDEPIGATAEYNARTILGQLNKIDKDIKALDRKIRKMDGFVPRHDSYKGFSHNKSVGENFGAPTNESFSKEFLPPIGKESFDESEGFNYGSSYGIGHSFGYTQTKDFKIERKGDNVKIHIIHPEKVDLRFEPEGRRISDHYYIEKVINGKTIIRLDETVKVYGR